MLPLPAPCSCAALVQSDWFTLSRCRGIAQQIAIPLLLLWGFCCPFLALFLLLLFERFVFALLISVCCSLGQLWDREFS